ncbi:tautomerase family protein [Plantactinospora soyae]|uniref:Ketosteroid isomerase-like protein/phenylpyruvate tautomerase PptA (4-oxalocrotonate tautomerase family) n=1 Tax=Plantactinospora soyae TaxID=1544732 RepID=A0A927QWB5_9ACTN|nr:tautomerase family protein [Plantactinospora soyae]MBE1485357.1 ketosteroid isomerase-like protein/phenylpyruvate tautomerase PptA (4-oxalocrotonate tautomerase family) [Plantactinospora soyae]
MPFVNISLARGKSDRYLASVSQAVHDALVAELNMKPDDNFQLIHQYDPGEMVFNRGFRGGPRSDDWIVFTITGDLDRGERAKRRFYQTLVRLLEERPGVRPADVFVTMTELPPEDFSFAGGVIGTEFAAAESLEAAAKAPGTRDTYTRAEMTYAVTQLFRNRDRGPILPMLRDDVVLTLPTTLPYGGEFTGPAAFGDFFAKTPGGGAVWKSFDSVVDDVLAADDHVIARLTNTAVPKATGKKVVFQNLWFFGVVAGRITSAQLYADTAATTSGAPG